MRVLRDTIADEMRAAMKAREQTRVSTLRMLMAAMKNTQVEKGHELSDDEVVEVVSREAKRRRESMEAFEKGGRAELVEKEKAELAVLEAYLPQQLGEDELAALVDEAISETGASSPKEMGAVMKVVMGKVKGRADGAAVSAMVRARLGA
ncbi:MAG TPA: GatB/YqeY domain-containing protein [Actinomycetota bacterium]|nr:GatB/YqeY domain-containing protein [Actinomycetota bacterium]